MRTDSRESGRVSFATFWTRLTTELRKLPSAGQHTRTVEKWSQHRGILGGTFSLTYKGGNVLECTTATTGKRRSIGRSEFEKVCVVWPDYIADRMGRSGIVNEMGVQNSSWIIPILHEYERLMSSDS
jgi:hypothetical protein